MSNERYVSMSTKSASRSTWTTHRTTTSESCSSLLRARAAQSRSVKDSPTHRPVHSATSFLSSRTLRRRGAGCSNAASRSVRCGTRRPSGFGTEVSHPGSTLRVETMPASPASPTQMATAGYYRNGATAIYDGVWTINSEVVQLEEKRAFRGSAASRVVCFYPTSQRADFDGGPWVLDLLH